MRVTIDANPEEVAAFVLQFQKQDSQDLYLKFHGNNADNMVVEDDRRVKADLNIGRELAYMW